MVQITNGQRTISVTSGVYKEMYRPLGWKIVGSTKEKSNADKVIDNEEKSPEIAKEDPERGNDENVMIPLSEMNVTELKAFAAEHDIDVSSAKNKQDMKAIISAEMED